MAKEPGSQTNVKGIGLFGLMGIVVSSCIGSGAFALVGQLAKVAAPGPAIIAWLVAGAGFLLLAFALSGLGESRPDLDGIFSYAHVGFGPFAGFLSGWGYWISCWLGNVAFANAMMSTLALWFPAFGTGGNSPVAVAVASVFMWAMTLLVIHGMESASFLNAVVMVVKVGALLVFVALAAAGFNAGVFTADFWGHVGLQIHGLTEEVSLGGPGHQVVSCLIVMMWCFIGIEGASVLSSRARSRKDAGRATVLGLLVLLVVYMAVSVLPYGVVPQGQIAEMRDTTSMAQLAGLMAPSWGREFMTVAMVVAVAGCWLSFTILPAETSQLMAEHRLLPGVWARLNAKGAPVYSLLMVAGCTQAFLVLTMFSEQAYDLALSICTVAIVVTWGLAAAFQVKESWAHGRYAKGLVGMGAVVFLLVGTLFEGIDYVLLSCIGYVPGMVVYALGRREAGERVFSHGEAVVAVLIVAGAAAAVAMIANGAIHV